MINLLKKFKNAFNIFYQFLINLRKFEKFSFKIDYLKKIHMISPIIILHKILIYSFFILHTFLRYLVENIIKTLKNFI